jgi:hypothetical protein
MLFFRQLLKDKHVFNRLKNTPFLIINILAFKLTYVMIEILITELKQIYGF